MSKKRMLPLALTLILFFGTMLLSARTSGEITVFNQAASTADSALGTSDEAEKSDTENEEMFGVWVSYMELDMQNEGDKSEEGFRKKFESIAKSSSEFGFNTLIVQVRPFSDALYNSEYFPYSHILTGTQGKDPGYDALEIMCEVADEYNMKIHAWINPYRISTGETPSALCSDNPYVLDSSLGKELDSGIYYDPSNEEARELIINGVIEIVENYDVDGIQFDDYFYPSDAGDFDKAEYAAYKESAGDGAFMSLDNWRLANVNILICETYKAVHSASDDVFFGVSPQGNLENNAEIYADVKSWCNCRGFIDYICPQIYFSLDNPELSFSESLESWLELDYDENVRLYIGLAGYKAGTDDADDGTWADSDSILKEEYELLSAYEQVDGMMLYSCSSLESEDAKAEMDNLKEALN